MKILVCFKVTPEPDRVLMSDFQKFSPDMDLSYAGLDFSCFDGPALELGLKLKEQLKEQGTSVSCSALTVGRALPDSFAQRLYSAGYEKVTWIPWDSPEFNPEAVAKLLAAEASDDDLILTGREAPMGETGMVPYLLAQNLHRELHADVEKITFQQGNFHILCRKSQGLYERQLKLPALLTVGNCPDVLRMATLRQQLKVRGRQAERKTPAILPPEAEKHRFRVPDTGRHCRMLDPDAPETFEKILKLLKAAGQEQGGEKPGQSLPKHLQRAVEERKLFLFPDTEGGRILAVKTAERKKLPCFFGGEIREIREDAVTVEKPAFGSNLLWEKVLPLPLVLTGDFPGEEEKHRELLKIPAMKTALAESSAVLICGNGMGSLEACRQGRAAARRLGAGFGLTRPAVMNGWGGPEEIVGQSGRILSPEVCLILGAAGAGPFLAGVRKAGTLIAVNTDPGALIFKSADYGVQMDAVRFLQRLSEVNAGGI